MILEGRGLNARSSLFDERDLVRAYIDGSSRKMETSFDNATSGPLMRV